MNLKQSVYFMTLVGGSAGLLCWFLQLLVSDALPRLTQPGQAWVFVAIYAALMGALIGGLTVGFADHWSSEKLVPSWAAVGALLGALAGTVAGLLYRVIAPLIAAGSAGAAGRVLPWLIAGGLIGLATGTRWVGVNPLRTFHATLGGLIGGGIGGSIYTVLGDQPFLQALAYMFMGAGITLGVTLAPVLLSDGVLQFVSSGDARAQNKFGSPRQEWIIQDGDRLILGSLSAAMTSTMFAQDVQIYIPDAFVSPRHAIVQARKKRFYLQLHPENADHVGQPLNPLQLGNDVVTGNGRELRHGDEIIVGQTLLRFQTRSKSAVPSEEAV